MILPSNLFALETLKKCNTEVVIDWMKRAGGGISDIGVSYPQQSGETSGPDETNEPRVLVIDSQDQMYIADPVNYQVLKFNKARKLMLKIKLQKANLSAPSYGNDIKDLTLDRFGNLYLINYYQNRIEIYTPGGNFIKMIDYAKDRLGELKAENLWRNYQPNYIQVDYDGNIYIYNILGLSYQAGCVYSKDGVFLRRLAAKEISPRYYKATRTHARILDPKMVDYSGYYIDDENYDERWSQRRILSLRDSEGNETGRCGPVQIEPTTRPYVDRKGNVYYFDFTTLNIVKVNMLGK